MSKMLKTFAAACMLLCLVQPALANDEKYKAAPIVGDNSPGNRLKKDSFSTVTDTVFFNTTLNPLISSSRVLNLVTFRINEYANIVLPSSFTAKVKFRVDLYTTTTSYTTVYDSLTISYSTTGNYDRLKVYTNNIGYKAIVTLTDSIIVTGATSAQVLPALALDNEIWVTRNYTFACSSGIQTISYADSVSARGELQVFWDFQPTATEYDLEWSYIDSTARTEYLTGGNFDAAKIFTNNATRVTISGTSYYIPMMYDNGGILFFRVRPVQVLPGNQRMEATWSSAYTYGMGRYDYGGHERGLNWQSTTSFAEEGKRKTVVQYFDGTLRGRQTVTRDNTTNTTVVAETFYDYQGRGVIQVLPAPTLDRLIKHTPAFNQFTTGGYEKDVYDPVISAGTLCSSSAGKLSNSYGAAKYYSPSNPLVNNTDENRFIPDAQGHPFTATQYSTDGTDRVLKQSGVGPKFALDSGRATQYFYGTADQEDIDLLFGTEAGVASHYSKNMVRDANGQFSVSYMDMHGRIVATALAGDHPASLDTLLSKNTRSITKSLIDASNTIIDGHSIITTKTFPVPKAGNHRFKYSLWPDSLSLATCDSNMICYDCMYDLEVTIWGECYNNSAPLVIRRSNLSINPADTACGTANIPLAIDTLVYLDEGEYIVTKKLTISMAGFEYLRDSVYMKRNLCKTKEDFIQEVLDSIKNNLECERTCGTCEAELGTWPDYRIKYMEVNEISPADSADFREEAYEAWLELKEECEDLCDTIGEDKNIRDAMLVDLTPPNGQFADPNAIDEFSIFRFNTLTGKRKYQDVEINYYDEQGNPDFGINGQGVTVPVKDLEMQDFINNFKPRWAEALLPLHPEYCKLQQIEAPPMPASYSWDEAFANEDSYSVAINKGWLNPTAGTGSPFNLFPTPSSGDRDPFFAHAGMSTWKAEMEDSMKNKVSKGGGQYISLWALATIFGKCEGRDEACVAVYDDDANAMDSTQLCTSEANMAWQAFRNLYLAEKREIISKMLKAGCPYTPALNAPHYSHFPDPQQAATTLLASYPTQQSVHDSLNVLIDSNCRAYVMQWWNELRPCNFNSTDSSVIIPKLINVCREGGDMTHPLGSSTVRPGSTSTDVSFEQVLKDYCAANSKPYDTACNVYLIKAPRPYSQQNVLVDQVVITRPDSCQCEQLDKYRNEYNRYRDSGETFAGYLARTINSTLTQGQLDTLQQACNGTLGCKFLSEPIVLPPAFQCGITEVCFDCVQVRGLHKSFIDEFGCTPVKVAASAAEEQVNRIYTAFMNNKTGFSKYAYEYLEFLDSCPASPTTTCDSLLQIVKEYRHHGNSVRASYAAQVQEGPVYDKPYQIIGFENDGNGFLRFPDSLRVQNVSWYNNPYILFYPSLCFPDGYEVEMKMKILRDTTYNLYGNSHYFYSPNSNVVFSRYVNPIYFGGVTYPPGIFIEDITGVLPGQTVFTPLNIDTNAIFEWQRYRVKFTKSTISVYCNSNHIRTVNRDSTVPLASIGTVVFGIRTRLGAIDDVKIRDYDGTLVYFESFNDTLYPAIPDSSAFCYEPADCEILFRNTFNTAMGTSYTYQQVLQYYQTHCGYIPEICGPPYDRGPKLCGKLEVTFPGTSGYPTACSDTLEQAIETGTILYNYYRDSVIKAFENAYIQKCLQNASKETFTVTHTMSEYHYTLYYYDQAGALVKTVPPQGVDYWLNKLKDDVSYGAGDFETGIATWLDEVKTARAGGTNKTVLYHLGTNYRYNTLGQVTQQKSPDGGLSKFWYDRLGRLVISQNAKQKAHADDEQYSYTLYDYLGRISEVGQLENSEADMTQTISRDTTSLKNWIAANASTKEQVTRTYYDIAPSTSLTGTEIYPRNLRNRVSYTTLTDGASSATAGYNYGAFYTYDIHGNVDTLLHDYGLGTSPPMGTVNIPNIMNMNGNRYKKIVYNYDLISGKVNLAQYSPGKVDRFYHRYEYDAENRITDVYTSADSIIWERDANYRYYKHGPLARTVLGEQQVQGIDYGYTLQGWLKGVNSTGIADAFYDFDMGNDGLSAGSNQYVARDALAFNLNYFDTDYEAINNTVSPFATVNNTHLSGNYRPLYNGNISSMAVSIRQLGDSWLYNYQYDQLNRIKGMDTYEGAYLTDINAWKDGPDASDKYRERVRYDANGNILRYLRNQAGGSVEMDSLQYWYQYKTTGGSTAYYNPETAVPSNAAELTNKLAYVDDIISDGASGVDIDDQLPGNYTYDEIGNLIADTKESISEIKWSVYGKILEITKEVDNDKTYIKYTYDASGNRIGKRVTKEGSVNSVEHTWYVRDAQGNTMAVYNYSHSSSLSSGTLRLGEQHLYGSSRLGIVTRDEDAEQSLSNGNILTFTRGNKFFELSNHLGNVLTTISDRKTPDNTTIGSAVTYYKPVIITANDYYPFGMLMPGRNYNDASNKDYRYGFNGKENDNDVKDIEGGQQDYGMRIYDPRLGRFLSVDPITKDYPELTPYQFASNRCIQGVDLDGKEVFLVTGTGNAFGFIVGYELGVGIGFGKDGIAFFGTQTLRAGFGAEIGASVNATLYPTMTNLKDIDGYAPGFSIAGGFLGRFGVAGSRSSGKWGGTLSYGIGVGAHVSADISFTLGLTIFSWKEVVDAIINSTEAGKPIRSFFNIDEKNKNEALKIINDYYKDMANGLLEKRKEDLKKANEKNSKIIVEGEEYLNAYEKLKGLSRKILRFQKNAVKNAIKKAEKEIQDNLKEFIELQKVEIKDITT